MEQETYTIEVERHNPLKAINEITQRAHDDMLQEFLANMPEPKDGIRYVQRGLLTRIATNFNYSSAGVMRFLERRGYYKLGIVPPSAPCFKNKKQTTIKN